MMLSECCDAAPWGGMEEYGLCGECRDHCEFYDTEKRDDQAFERTTRDAMQDFSPAQEETIARIIAEANECPDCESNPCVCCKGGDPRDPSYDPKCTPLFIGAADGTSFYKCVKCGKETER